MCVQWRGHEGYVLGCWLVVHACVSACGCVFGISCWCVWVGRMLMTESLAVHQDITHMYIHTYTGAHKHLVDTCN